MTETDDSPVPGTWLEIDAAALRHNIRELQQAMAPAEVCMVVKGDAYGHGYDPIVPLAEEAGVKRFAVFSGREAAHFLQASRGDSRLMVMGHAHRDNLPWMIANGMEPWINDPSDWPAVKEALKASDATVRVHLELETGMNRTGLPLHSAFDVAKSVHEHPKAILEGVCTHMAGAEDERNATRITHQRRRYFDFLERLDEAGIAYNTRHVASSAAALRHRYFRLDMVRLGIACYGLWPSLEVRRDQMEADGGLTLEPVLRWRSQVMALKDIPDGDYVGYGASYQAEGPIRIAVVPVGYADGFARDLSNRGHVLIGGKRCSIIGNVNMNMVQVHVTHVPDIQCGDEVILIGEQGEERISVGSFSEFNNVVNYELMSRLSREIPRIVVDDEAEAGPRMQEPEATAGADPRRPT